jgi:dipeptidyl aminopeptidase/acylaminoacyl peptidase
MRFFFALVVSSFLVPLSLQAQWTAEDIVNAEQANGYEFSPDGRAVVWVKRLPSKEKDAYFTKLFLTRLDQKEAGKYLTLQLTRGEESDRSPIFSKDGKLIYFLSSREKGKKLWALPVAGGEPYEIKTFENAPGSLRYLNDSTFVYTASEGKTLYETELESRKDEVQVVEDTAHFKPTRLFAFDLKTKEIRRLSDNRLPVAGFATSKDGRWLVSSHTGSPHYGADAQPKPVVYLWNTQTGEKVSILPAAQYQTPGSFTFTEDGSGFYFSSTQSNDPLWNGAGVQRLHFFDLGTRQVQPIDLKWDWGLAGGLERVGNHLLVGLANGATIRTALVEKRGTQFSLKPLAAGTYDDHLFVQALSADKNRIIFTYSTASTPTQVHVGKIVTDARKGTFSLASEGELMELNPGFRKKPIAQSEVMKWKGWKGEEVDGILYYPKNYRADRRYPLVVAIHGGPSGTDLDAWGESWAYAPQILTQKGAFVLRPNYHGSSNHGLAFVESIAKNYYEPELEDITKGIDALVAKGYVDRDSMGVMGWSNGAILTTMLTVRYPTMFKVAAPGAGDVNWTSDFGTCQFGVSFDQHYFGGAPWDDVDGKSYNEVYITKSPLFELEKVRTPTIIFHGSEDRQVPRDQGYEYYRALQQIKQAPVRFLWFPGAFHGLTKLTHQLRKINEEQAWFDQHLFGRGKTENEAFKKESPLAMLLEREKAVRDEMGAWGTETRVNGKNYLIPETVSLGKDTVQIGRFEITGAQYLSFGGIDKALSDNDLTLADGFNFPKRNVTYEQAQAYCRWLSEKTGQRYRLPNAREARALHEKARTVAAQENVLNAWAGYTLTRDEVPPLMQKVRELKTSTLFKPVGTYKPVKIGQADIYDLGGNVAEWYTKEDGTAGTYGYSAYDFVDPAGQPPRPEPAHVGFRVVREK